MSKRNIQRAARHIQAECGASYTTAYQFVQENRETIMKMILIDNKPDWREYNSAAAGLWRKSHGR